MNEHYAKLITTFPLFAGHTNHGAQFLINCGEVRVYEPGEVLCREGDPPAFATLVLSGKVEVFVERDGRTLVLTEAGPGAILGELAVLCGMPRSASMRANGKVEGLQWPPDSFRRMLLGNAFLSERILGNSLRILVERERTLIDSLQKHANGQKG